MVLLLKFDVHIIAGILAIIWKTDLNERKMRSSICHVAGCQAAWFLKKKEFLGKTNRET